MAKHDDIKDNQLVKSIYEETAASEYESRSLLSEQRSEADLAYTSCLLYTSPSPRDS